MNRLKQLRIERKMTQEELAFQLDTSQQRISKLERCLVPMNEETIVRCVRIFGVTADYLLGMSDVKAGVGVDFSGTGKWQDIWLHDLLYYYKSLDETHKKILRSTAKAMVEECKFHPVD